MSIVSRFPCSGEGGVDLKDVWRWAAPGANAFNMALMPSRHLIWATGYLINYTIYGINESDGSPWGCFNGADIMTWALGADSQGYVYAGGNTCALHKYNPGFGTVWTYTTSGGTLNGVALCRSGCVYTGNAAGYCALLNSNGGCVWSSTFSDGNMLALITDSVDNLCFGTRTGTIRKISVTADYGPDLSTGHTAGVYCLAIDSKDNIYVGLDDGFVCKLSPAGTVEWESKVVDGVVYALAVDTNGKVYASGSDSTLHGLGSDGTKAWSVSIKPSYFTHLAVVESDIIALDSVTGVIRRISSPAAGKLYLNPNIYDKAEKKPLEVDWVQKTDDPHQLLIFCRGGTKKEGI